MAGDAAHQTALAGDTEAPLSRERASHLPVGEPLPLMRNLSFLVGNWEYVP
jgi:hypothetical protein